MFEICTGIKHINYLIKIKKKFTYTIYLNCNKYKFNRTSTAPAPLNLITTWLLYLIKLCKKRAVKKQRPSLVHLMGLHRTGRMSPRSKMGAKWLSKVKKTKVSHKDSIAMSVAHLSPLGSQLSFSNALRIETVVDWDVVRRKYLELFGDEADKVNEEIKEDVNEPLATVNEETPVTSSNELV